MRARAVALVASIAWSAAHAVETGDSSLASAVSSWKIESGVFQRFKVSAAKSETVGKYRIDELTARNPQGVVLRITRTEGLSGAGRDNFFEGRRRELNSIYTRKFEATTKAVDCRVSMPGAGQAFRQGSMSVDVLPIAAGQDLSLFVCFGTIDYRGIAAFVACDGDPAAYEFQILSPDVEKTGPPRKLLNEIRCKPSR